MSTKKTKRSKKCLVVVRGGGDLATGTIHKLCKSGYSVVILETEKPMAIRRNVAFSEAVYDGQTQVEDLVCIRAQDVHEAKVLLEDHNPVLLVDPKCESLKELDPDVLVDAILAKKNLGTNLTMAGLVIGLGPGFVAGEDVDYVIETMRGHDLGRIIADGPAAPNTGVPGMIGGVGAERVIHAPAEGMFFQEKQISDMVTEGDRLGYIEYEGNKVVVEAAITGVLRGVLRDQTYVKKGLKMADIDPRVSEVNNCFTISDKARCIAGSVLELVVAYEHGNRR